MLCSQACWEGAAGAPQGLRSQVCFSGAISCHPVFPPREFSSPPCKPTTISHGAKWRESQEVLPVASISAICLDRDCTLRPSRTRDRGYPQPQGFPCVLPPT